MLGYKENTNNNEFNFYSALIKDSRFYFFSKFLETQI